MKIIIDAGHPADFHLLRNFASKFLEKGHKILFTCREKECVIELLDSYGFPYKSFGINYSSIAKKMWGLLKYDIMMIMTSIKFKPDIFLSHSSMYAAQAAFILGKPHIAFEDTFNFEQIRLYEPFSKVVLTSDYDHPLKKEKVIKYAGYHELAYLHRNNFKPDRSVLKELDLAENEKYTVIRFVSWNATHDRGHSGISFENKIKAVKEFGKKAKVFISSEGELPDELKKYQLRTAPHEMHNILAFASMLFGESATMAAECAMLGVPSIYLDDTGRYYTRDLEKKYGLIFNYTETQEDQKKAIDKGIEILNTPNILEEWQRRRNIMLSEKIDVTAFLVWFVENYPESVKVMRQNPDYQLRFR